MLRLRLAKLLAHSPQFQVFNLYCRVRINFHRFFSLKVSLFLSLSLIISKCTHSLFPHPLSFNLSKSQKFTSEDSLKCRRKRKTHLDQPDFSTATYNFKTPGVLLPWYLYTADHKAHWHYILQEDVTYRVLHSGVILGNLFHLSEPQGSHLINGRKKSFI